MTLSDQAKALQLLRRLTAILAGDADEYWSRLQARWRNIQQRTLP